MLRWDGANSRVALLKDSLYVPVGLAAGIATLDCLAQPGTYERLEELGQVFDSSLADSLREFRGAGTDDERPLRWRRVGSLLWLHLSSGELPRAAGKIDPAAVGRYAPLHRELLDGGQYLAPSAHEVAFLSTAHSPEEVCALARAIARHATIQDPQPA